MVILYGYTIWLYYMVIRYGYTIILYWNSNQVHGLFNIQKLYRLQVIFKFYNNNCSSNVYLVDLWGCFVGRIDMHMRDGLRPRGKDAAVFADELSAAVHSCMSSVCG